MDNIDFIHRTEKPSSPERYKVPMEVSLEIQMKLPLIMAGQYLGENLIQGDFFNDERFQEGLLNRFVEKYVCDYNGLDDYCGNPKSDAMLVNRLQTGTYTEADLVVVATYMQSSAPDRKFFEDEDEVKEFLRQYIH